MKKPRLEAILRILPGAAVAGVLVLGTLPSGATPFTWGEDVEPLRWPAEDKTLNVYIEPDPDGAAPDRSELIRQGIARWNAELTGRGLTLNIVVGAVPDPAPDCLVRVDYEPVGSRLILGEGDDGGGEEAPTLGDDNYGLAGSTGPLGGNLESGRVILRDDLPAGTAQERDFLRNLAAHEITHVLGLADDEAGSVTRHLQGNTPATFNDHDRDEIGMLYPLDPEDPPRAEGELEEGGTGGDDLVAGGIAPRGGPGLTTYLWRFVYQGPADGHVALITLGIRPSLIEDVICPVGWECLDPSDPARTSRSDPYYDGYNEDSRPGRSPWAPELTPPVAFRADAPGAALNTANPEVVVGVVARNDRLGLVPAWAGGDLAQIEGPVPASVLEVPTLSRNLLVILATLLALGGSLVILRRTGS